MVILALIIFGLILGSFVNAWVWRVKTDRSVKKGRSMCPNCKHQLSAMDLVPIFSWLILRAKCRYCKKPISGQYPLVELVVPVIFVVSYIFWPTELNGASDITLFIAWILASVGLVALFIFDLKWMLLPDVMIYPILLIAAVGTVLHIALGDAGAVQAVIAWLLAVLIASGLFKAIYHLSKGKWIGYGDVRLGWVTGTLLATPGKAMLMIFSASLIGSLTALPTLLAKKNSLKLQIAFGPFLIIGTFIAMLWGQKIIDWYVGLYS